MIVRAYWMLRRSRRKAYLKKGDGKSIMLTRNVRETLLDVISKTKRHMYYGKNFNKRMIRSLHWWNVIPTWSRTITWSIYQMNKSNKVPELFRIIPKKRESSTCCDLSQQHQRHLLSSFQFNLSQPIPAFRNRLSWQRYFTNDTTWTRILENSKQRSECWM